MATHTRMAASVRIALLVVTAALAGCGIDNRQAPADRDASPPPGGALERAVIQGSAETPDPVLARVRELEARGLVTDVVVMESFPVQIQLRAPRAVIDDLQAMPRVGAAR